MIRTEVPVKKQCSTLGCCGIDCGLCPRYYTDGASRCPGCCGDGFELVHPPCGFVTCCVKKNELEVCAQCESFPCGKFDRGTSEFDSFVTHRNVIPNQEQIRKSGLPAFLAQQQLRMDSLKHMLDDYDDGRSKSFYCLAAALLSADGLQYALTQAEQRIESEQIDSDNRRSKAKILRQTLEDAARTENTELQLRKKPKH